MPATAIKSAQLSKGKWIPIILLALLVVAPFILKTLLKEEKIAQTTLGQEQEVVDEIRFELLSSLDIFVKAQRVLKQSSGSYGTALGRAPDVLGAMTSFYTIQLLPSSQDHIFILAESAAKDLGLSSGITDSLSKDRVLIDERFQVKMNFNLPTPPVGYLRAIAQSVLNRIQSQSYSTLPSRSILDMWEGVYRRHLKYEWRTLSSGGRVPVAIPSSDLAIAVLGNMEIGLDSGVGRDLNLFDWVLTHRQTVGGEILARAKLREIYLAQRILKSETGHYADTLNAASSAWNGLESLNSPNSALRLDEFQMDTVAGYQAEVALVGIGKGQIKNLWSINGDGQVMQINPVEELMGQFNQIRKGLDGERSPSSNSNEKNPLVYDSLGSEAAIFK